MDAEAIHQRRWKILGILCISLFLAVVDNTIVNVALPTMSRSLKASNSQLQWIVDAYSLVFASLLLVGGSLGDRFGRKLMLQSGLALFAGFSALAAFSSGATSLIVLRGLMGVGSALIFPATLAILTNVFRDPVERAKAIGAWSGVIGLAVALGPITGGVLLRHFWWGSIFLVNLPIAAAAILLGAKYVPTSKDPDTPPLDYKGFVTSIAAVFAVVYTTIQAPEHGWASARTLGGYGFAAVALALFVVIEFRQTHPMLDVAIFKNVRFTSASLSITLCFFAFFGFIFLITQYFQFVRGYDTLSSGLHTLPFAVVSVMVAPFSPRLAMRFGGRAVVTSGLAIMSLGFFLAANVTATSSYWVPIVGPMALLAMGLGLTTAPSTTMILAVLPPDKAGVGSAINDTTRELGGTLGVAVIGSVFSSVYGPKLVSALKGLPIPGPALEAARSSVGAAFEVARQTGGQGGQLIANAARSSFVDGWAAGCLVSAFVVLGAAALAATLLPGRISDRDQLDRDILEFGADLAHM